MDVQRNIALQSGNSEHSPSRAKILSAADLFQIYDKIWEWGTIWRAIKTGS
jgi:hypothetical protein